MPLIKLKLKAEERLASSQLYSGAAADERPGDVLEGIAMAGLVGIVRQLGELAEYAAGVFEGLNEEVQRVALRGQALKQRVKRLERQVPPVESAILKGSNPLQFVYAPGVEWVASSHIEQNLFTGKDPPQFVQEAHQICRELPQLHLLDRFDPEGDGSCMRRYSNPSYFKTEWASAELIKAHVDRKGRKDGKDKKRSTSPGENNQPPNPFMNQQDSTSFMLEEPDLPYLSSPYDKSFVDAAVMAARGEDLFFRSSVSSPHNQEIHDSSRLNTRSRLEGLQEHTTTDSNGKVASPASANENENPFLVMTWPRDPKQYPMSAPEEELAESRKMRHQGLADPHDGIPAGRGWVKETAAAGLHQEGALPLGAADLNFVPVLERPLPLKRDLSDVSAHLASGNLPGVQLEICDKDVLEQVRIDEVHSELADVSLGSEKQLDQSSSNPSSDVLDIEGTAQGLVLGGWGLGATWRARLRKNQQQGPVDDAGSAALFAPAQANDAVPSARDASSAHPLPLVPQLPVVETVALAVTHDSGPYHDKGLGSKGSESRDEASCMQAVKEDTEQIQLAEGDLGTAAPHAFQPEALAAEGDTIRHASDKEGFHEETAALESDTVLDALGVEQAADLSGQAKSREDMEETAALESDTVPDALGVESAADLSGQAKSREDMEETAALESDTIPDALDMELAADSSGQAKSREDIEETAALDSDTIPDALEVELYVDSSGPVMSRENPEENTALESDATSDALDLELAADSSGPAKSRKDMEETIAPESDASPDALGVELAADLSGQAKSREDMEENTAPESDATSDALDTRQAADPSRPSLRVSLERGLTVPVPGHEAAAQDSTMKRKAKAEPYAASILAITPGSTQTPREPDSIHLPAGKDYQPPRITRPLFGLGPEAWPDQPSPITPLPQTAVPILPGDREELSPSSPARRLPPIIEHLHAESERWPTLKTSQLEDDLAPLAADSASRIMEDGEPCSSAAAPLSQSNQAGILGAVSGDQLVALSDRQTRGAMDEVSSAREQSSELSEHAVEEAGHAADQGGGLPSPGRQSSGLTGNAHTGPVETQSEPGVDNQMVGSKDNFMANTWLAGWGQSWKSKVNLRPLVINSNNSASPVSSLFSSPPLSTPTPNTSTVPASIPALSTPADSKLPQASSVSASWPKSDLKGHVKSLSILSAVSPSGGLPAGSTEPVVSSTGQAPPVYMSKPVSQSLSYEEATGAIPVFNPLLQDSLNPATFLSSSSSKVPKDGSKLETVNIETLTAMSAQEAEVPFLVNKSPSQGATEEAPGSRQLSEASDKTAALESFPKGVASELTDGVPVTATGKIQDSINGTLSKSSAPAGPIGKELPTDRISPASIAAQGPNAQKLASPVQSEHNDVVVHLRRPQDLPGNIGIGKWTERALQGGVVPAGALPWRGKFVTIVPSRSSPGEMSPSSSGASEKSPETSSAGTFRSPRDLTRLRMEGARGSPSDNGLPITRQSSTLSHSSNLSSPRSHLTSPSGSAYAESSPRTFRTGDLMQQHTTRTTHVPLWTPSGTFANEPTIRESKHASKVIAAAVASLLNKSEQQGSSRLAGGPTASKVAAADRWADVESKTHANREEANQLRLSRSDGGGVSRLPGESDMVEGHERFPRAQSVPPDVGSLKSTSPPSTTPASEPRDGARAQPETSVPRLSYLSIPSFLGWTMFTEAAKGAATEPVGVVLDRSVPKSQDGEEVPNPGPAPAHQLSHPPAPPPPSLKPTLPAPMQPPADSSQNPLTARATNEARSGAIQSRRKDEMMVSSGKNIPGAPVLSVEREAMLLAIKNKAYSLRPTPPPAYTGRRSDRRMDLDINVAAILEKANSIRQALAGSDSDASDWSD